MLSFSDSDPMTARPASSANPSLKTPNRPYSVKLTQQRGTRSGLIRLAPIDRSKTPNVVRWRPIRLLLFLFCIYEYQIFQVNLFIKFLI